MHFIAKPISLLIAIFFVIGTAYGAEYKIVQQGKAFLYKGKETESLDIRVGDTVHFINEDKFFHVIFSNSGDNSFTTARSSMGEKFSQTFSHKGTVEVECKMHTPMYLEIRVR